ncbi:MAG: MFS transporter, partial [Burkholderiales bacterium]|nr:MFS transporter [Burkholderiales bacterium]
MRRRTAHPHPLAPEPFSLRRIAIPAYGPSLLFGIGEGAILPIVPLSARQLGASVSEAALVVTLIGIGSLISNVPASLITMRRGERWALVAAALWCALAMALGGTTGRFVVFAAACFMIGMSQAVFSLARQSFLAQAVPPAFRARALSTLGGSMRIGLFIGPFAAAAAIHRWGLVGAYGVGIAALLLAGAVGARLPELRCEPAGEAAAAPAPGVRTILRERRHVLLTLGIGVMLVSAVRATRQAVIPLWADHLGLAPSVAALIYGVAGGIDMLMFYPSGHLMDLKGRRWVAVPSMLVMGAALLATPLAHGATALMIAAAAIGFGNGIGSGMVMTLGADHSPRSGRAHFLGVWRLMSDLGATAGPALLSLLAAAATLGTGIAVTGLIAVAAAAQLAYWIP